jgi:Protein of unknown function (DUF4239)
VNFYWVYDIPSWQFAALTISTFVGIALCGHRLTQRWVKKIAGNTGMYNDLVSTTLATVGVFYGITLGLISVGAWQNFTDVSAQVSQEASLIAVMYRDVSGYPEPARTELQNSLKDYTKYIINEAWPAQRKGIVPIGGNIKVSDFQNKLFTVEPVKEGQKALHAVALSEFSEMIKARRLRLQSVTAGLPANLWSVVIFGALINIFIPWFLVFNRQLMQDLMSVLMASTIGLLIFLMGAMDNPFRGDFSVGSDAFQLIYNQLMK